MRRSWKRRPKHTTASGSCSTRSPPVTRNSDCRRRATRKWAAASAATPRALRLLGRLLRIHDLEELIGPPRAVPEGLIQEQLASDLERSLLGKARQGLSNAADQLLRELAILPEPASVELIRAVGGHIGEVGALLRELQERFLVEQQRALRHVHPVAREVELPGLVRDSVIYCSANLRAGQWYAARLTAAAHAPINHASIALNLAGARYHLLAAGAHAELRVALETIRPYIKSRFGWHARLPSTAAERDAQISFLELFVVEPGDPAIDFHLARLLRLRGQGDDLAQALQHAKRATVDQDFSHPWVLRVQLAYANEGPEAAVAHGREALKAVAPAKNLVSVYQVVGAALNDAGRDQDAIELCFQGAMIPSINNPHRLIEEALAFAAAMPTSAALKRVRAFAEGRESLKFQAALADILLDEYAGEWRRGAEQARIARRQNSAYLHFALHEAFCWLGADEPDEAQRALDNFVRRFRFEARNSNTWLAAVVAAQCGETERARDLAETYIEGPSPTSLVALKELLLREWDTRVQTLGEPNPALTFPILPPSLSGLTTLVIRTQHGLPILPQHSAAANVAEAPSARLSVLAVGTEWTSEQGGLSTFNRQLCCALAEAGVAVACIAINPSTSEVHQAKKFGVRLVPARVTPGVDEREWLARRPAELGGDYSPDFIIGHGRITGPAALRLAEDSFSNAKRLHFVHMAPDEIEWHKLDREASAGLRAEDRTRQELDLGQGAYRVVAVGPRLHDRYARDLHPLGVTAPIRFDPGFDAPESGEPGPPPGAPWKVLLLGRAEDHVLKGVDLAARALGRVAQARDKALATIEFVIRGAKPEDVDGLRRNVMEWAEAPRLQVVVRPYTAEEATLDQDMRSSSLVLMPSRREGFGLVGLEAILTGTPTLVSSSSGLAKLLKEILQPEQAARVIIETTGDEGGGLEADLVEWERAIDALLRDREAAFRRAVELRELLRTRCTWRTSIEALLAALTHKPGMGESGPPR